VQAVGDGVFATVNEVEESRISARVSAIRRRWVGGPISGSAGLSGELSCFVSCSGCRGPFFGFVCGDGEEGVGKHGKGDMSVPGVPGADL